MTGVDDAPADVVPLRDEWELRADLLLALSHDLRASLAGVALLAEQLIDRHGELDPRRVEESLRRIHRTAQQAVVNLNDLPDLREPGFERITDRRRVTDIGAFTEDILAALDTGDRPVEVRVERVEALVDAVLYRHIVENLVLNACSHAPSLSPIVVTCQRSRDEVELVVQDDGDGIPDEEKQQIFELRHTSDDSERGHGIGLYLVARFARHHGGHAWVSDDPAGGAAFHVTFPLGRVEQDHQAAMEPAAADRDR